MRVLLALMGGVGCLCPPRMSRPRCCQVIPSITLWERKRRAVLKDTTARTESVMHSIRDGTVFLTDPRGSSFSDVKSKTLRQRPAHTKTLPPLAGEHRDK